MENLQEKCLKIRAKRPDFRAFFRKKKKKKQLTSIPRFVKIVNAADEKAAYLCAALRTKLTIMNMERYRSGHNEAVLKTVCPQGRMGSNPILSARRVFISALCRTA